MIDFFSIICVGGAAVSVGCAVYARLAKKRRIAQLERRIAQLERRCKMLRNFYKEEVEVLGGKLEDKELDSGKKVADYKDLCRKVVTLFGHERACVFFDLRENPAFENELKGWFYFKYKKSHISITHNGKTHIFCDDGSADLTPDQLAAISAAAARIAELNKKEK